MGTAKVAISIDSATLKKLDHYVKKNVFKSRSHAFQESVNKTLETLEHQRLKEECKKLNQAFEQKMAEDGLEEDMKAWPKY